MHKSIQEEVLAALWTIAALVAFGNDYAVWGWILATKAATDVVCTLYCVAQEARARKKGRKMKDSNQLSGGGVMLAERIKKIRKARELTQLEFAKRIGITAGHISQVETGTSIPSNHLVKSICREFNVREKWLLYGESVLSEKDGYTVEEIEDFENEKKRYLTKSEVAQLALEIAEKLEEQTDGGTDAITVLTIAAGLFYRRQCELVFKP